MGVSTTQLNDAAETTADAASSTADRVWEELDVTERWVREVAREYPITCFLGAVMSGYLIGRIARRI